MHMVSAPVDGKIVSQPAKDTYHCIVGVFQRGEDFH